MHLVKGGKISKQLYFIIIIVLEFSCNPFSHLMSMYHTIPIRRRSIKQIYSSLNLYVKKCEVVPPHNAVFTLKILLLQAKVNKI